jgi:hypothetical protein
VACHLRKRLPEFCRVTSRFRVKRLAGTGSIRLGSRCAQARRRFFSAAGGPVLQPSFTWGMDRDYAFVGGACKRRIAGRMALCRIVPQGVDMITVAPALSGPQHPGVQERPYGMYDVSLSLQIVQPLPHPCRDVAAFKDLALKHGAGCTGQSVRSAFDLRGPVELWRDRL